jgi:hypothetical protein
MHIHSWNPAHREVFLKQLYAIKFVSDLRQGLWFSLDTLVSSTNKTVVLSVPLRYADSDSPFGIFILFLKGKKT